MKIKNTIRFIVQILARRIPFVARRRTGSQPPPEQLSLNLDHITDSGLPLREAIPVRSAEYWLRLGEPGLALKELKTLPEPVLRHAWPQRVYSEAIHSTPNRLAA